MSSVINSFKDKIFSANENNFAELALEIFNYQAKTVPVYREYISLLNVKPAVIQKVEQIPFLPLQFFKSHKVISENATAEVIFESSTTTGAIPSKHFVADISAYIASVKNAFELFFGSPQDYIFLALLPNYLERGNSSLVFMVQKLMEWSGNEHGGFYLYDNEKLAEKITFLQENHQEKKIFLIGVSYALLDLAERFKMDLSDAIIMETGGMKGRRQELIRPELHKVLKEAFLTDAIYSEYGMTELLSQAYSFGDGIFNCPLWMKVLVRDATDPFSYVAENQSGGLNIIDLANLNSCSFLQTQDIGVLRNNDSFEVLGRFDNADIRGCSLMYT